MKKRKFLWFISLVLGLAALPWGIDLGCAATGPNPDVNYDLPNYANSPILRKFVDLLPGLCGVSPWSAPGKALGTNGLDQCIPVATAGVLPGFPNDDYYEIALVEYREQMHSDLPPVVGVSKTDPLATGGTKLRGYVQEVDGVAVGEPHYLGPLIIGTAGKPVRIKFTNRLPVGTAGDLFLPVDTTIMGAGMGPDGVNSYTDNRATLHLHGGNTPWISDGTPHQWTVPAGETTPYQTGVSTQPVPDMPLPPNGSMTFYYPNQQSGRLMFYHDHAYGITRLNVYAGEAAGYLLQDKAGTGEWTLGLPAVQIPLIIQDKTFVPGTAAMAAQDPTWDTAKWGGLGNLWFPHVYMTNQDPDASDGSNPMGRWDYGPWFWPVFPVIDLLPGTTSSVPEAFMDTPVVNGTAYPYLEVEPQAYRFRILNACNDRFLNLQLYQSDPAISFPTAGLTEVKMVDFIPGVTWPAGWGTPDARDGGVPDPALRGPAMIQIGTEGGLLREPAVINNIPIDYDYNRRSVTVLNVLEHALFLGPAERADVIIDFSRFAGKTLILYNDAPAPVPASDPRVDYYTGNPDFSETDLKMGGAPSTQPGFGPNTRTIMQIRVGAGADSSAPPDYYDPGTLTALQAAMPAAFAATQDPFIVPQGVYARINETSLNVSGLPHPLESITVTAGGTGYISPPTVRIIGGGGSGATATTTVANGAVTAINLINHGSGYTSTPTVSLFGGRGRNAAAIAKLVGAIPMKAKAIQELFDPFGRMNSTLGVELPATNALIQTTIPLMYIDPPTETFQDGETQIWKITHNGVDTHAIHFHLFNAQLINRVGWDNAVKPPDANELGWKETIRMNPLEDIIIAVKAKSQALPFGVPVSVRPLDVTQDVGSTGQFTNVDPLTNTPITVTNDITNFGWEYVWHCHLLGHEENDMMRPLVMQVPVGVPAAPVLSAAAAGTPVVPLVNLSWTDGTPANAPSTPGNPQNEIGFRIERALGNGAFAFLANALANATAYTDAAVLPVTQYRYRVTAFNAAGNSVSNIQTVTTLGTISVTAPTSLSATLQAGPQVLLSWTDNATNETGFVVERSTNGGPFTQIGTPGPSAGTGSTVAFNDNAVSPNNTLTYQVKAVSGAVSSLYSNTASVTIPNVPVTPTNLNAKVQTQGSTSKVALTWTENPNIATSFTIQRATDQGFTHNLNTSTTTTTSLIQSVSRPKTYYYRVRANNSAGSSAWSNVLTVIVP
jgi:FtsP/CotA-like multicopper oxidase with cupredoxin domain